MALPLYLAMTSGEFKPNPLPEYPAYMACHFSLYGKGLQDLPASLPDGCMLILSDRIPVWKHDPGQIAEELSGYIDAHNCGGCLLDLQRPGEALTRAIVEQITDSLPCPVAVTESYADGVRSAVLIASPRVNEPLKRRISPWQGRELWLEIAPQAVRYTVTKDSSTPEEINYEGESYPHRDLNLCCSYRVETDNDRAVFTLGRTREDLKDLLDQGEKLGFTRAVGLYQQLGNWFSIM